MEPHMSLKSCLAALAAYATFTLIALLLTLVILLLVLASPFFFLVAIHKMGWQAATSRMKPNAENLAFFQDRAYSLSLPNSLHRDDFTPIHVNGEEVAQMHATFVTRERTEQEEQQHRPVLLFVHGTGGSALSFADSFDILTSNYDVYGLDLPGFSARSPCSPSIIPSLRHMEAVEFYCSCLQAFIEKHKLTGVTMVAHSFGGFLAAEFVRRHPTLVGKLVLVNPAGMFPTLGDMGAYWAVFFKLSLPQSILRGLGMLGSFAITSMLRALSDQADLYLAAYQLLAAPDAFGDRIVGDFIEVRATSSIWTKPALPIMLTSKVPFAFIYGGADGIMPSHQGETISKLSCEPIPVCVVDGAGHSPMSEMPALFCKAFHQAAPRACRPGEAATKLATKITQDNLLTPHSSSYSTGITSARIAELYDMLLTLCNEVGGTIGGKSWASNVLFSFGSSDK